MYVRITYPKVQCFTSNGDLAVGYKIYTYLAGTSTAATTYLERTLSTANTNPIILNSRGEADIYVGQATKLILTTPNGTPASPIWTVDYIGEIEQTELVIEDADVGTANNNYTVTPSPALTSLDGVMLVMTPDTDVVTTLTSQAPDAGNTGVDDATFTGPYTGTTSGSTYEVEIDSTGTPDTFKWRKDAGAYTTLVNITADPLVPQALAEGVKVTFSTDTGHVLGDKWVLTVETPARINVSSLGNKLVYKNVGGTLTALSAGDMKQDIPATLVYSTNQTCWILNNPSDTEVSSQVPNRLRKIKTGNYNVLAVDKGNEISCDGTFTLTLPDAIDVSGSFFYFTNTGTGIITIDAGTYNIFSPVAQTGATTYTLYGYSSVQLQTNGVDWHVMTFMGYPRLVEVQDPVAASSVSFTGLVPGNRYRLEYQLTQNTAGAAHAIQFNTDGAANYVSTLGYFSSAATGYFDSTTRVVMAEDVVLGSLSYGEFEFTSYHGDDTKVRGFGRSHWNSTGLGNVVGVCQGHYAGAADMASIQFLPDAGTVTGRIWLWNVGVG